MKKIAALLLLLPLLLLMAVPMQAQTFRAAPTLDAAMAGFGGAVAVAEGQVLIAEPRNTYKPGQVYVYAPDAEGDWSEQTALTADDAALGDRFGATIASDGARLLISATRHNEGRGAGYIFEWQGSMWKQVAQLIPDDVASGDNLGQAVALDGNFAFISTTSKNENSGAVYVFHRQADGTWRQQAKLTGSDTAESDRFGSAISVQGHHALIGAPRHGGNAGAAYIFHYDEASQTWMQHHKLTSEMATGGSAFGSSVLLHGDMALVGAPRKDRLTGGVFAYWHNEENGSWDERAYVVPLEGAVAFTTESQDPTLIPFSDTERSIFGAALATAGDDVIIGAPGVNNMLGRAYVFRRGDDGKWDNAARLSTDAAEGRAFFGGALAAEGNVAVAGVPGADFGSGLAVIFERDEATNAWAEAATILSKIESLDPIVGGEVKCEGGNASLFGCDSVDLLSFIPLKDIGGGRGVRANDVWGWTDPETGKEYALVGRSEGTSFVDISDPYNPVYLGNLPKTEGVPGSTWRDMKVYMNHAYIVADGAGPHGMQVFDLTQLRDVPNPPMTFKETAHYDKIASAHNIVINEDTGFAYSVGSSAGGETCGGGLHMINIQEPARPTFAGCFADPSTGRRKTGYTHDAQCVTYNGPDTEHQGHEICFAANETALSIANVTDKENPEALSAISYPNVGYSHQGWLTEDQRFFYMNDELDELSGNVDGTRTIIWDVSDLEDPQLVLEYISDSKASDHNLYIRGNLMYQSNYLSGLRIFDITDPANPVEVGYFDTVPFGENGAGFGGSWSNYPFFPSGSIIVSSMDEGLFILRKKDVDI